MRTIKRWVTINGNHIPIYDDNLVTADAPINLNGTEYSYNGFPVPQYSHIATKYSDMLKTKDIADIAWKFFQDTGVHINVTGLNEESLCMVMDTVAQLKSEYSFALIEITNASQDMIDEHPRAYAWMGSSGNLYLNPHYWNNPRSVLDGSYAEDVQVHYHPKGNAQSIIAHEIGHAIFNRYIQNVMSDREDIKADFNAWSNHWSAIHDYVNGGDNKRNTPWDPFEIKFDADTYRNSPGYKQIVDTIDSMSADIQQDPYLIKQWGGRPNISFQALIQYTYNFDDAISNYAGKNITEMVAEAFADVYMNKEDASYMSKYVYKHILEGMKL